MPNRPSQPWVNALLIALVVVIATGIWLKVSSVPPAIRARLGFWESLTFRSTLITNPPTPAQVAAQRPAARALKDKLAAEFPALKTAARPVPADRNGYLLLYQLLGPAGLSTSSLPISEDFRHLIQ